MTGRKGIALSTNALVIIIIVILVLVVTVTFFILAGGGAITRAEQERTFRENCLAICARPDRGSANLAALFPAWQSACEQLHDVEPGAYLQCLDLCGPGCLIPASPCDYLCSFEGLVDDWPQFCERIRTHPDTEGTYGQCDCACLEE